MMKRTLETNRQLYALITRLGIDNISKQEMCLSVSNGRTTHTSELTDLEAKKLIDKLTQSRRHYNELEQQLRRNVFKLMYDIGLINNGMSNTEKVNYIDGWIKNKLNIDKHLNALTFDELTKFIKQLQAIRRNYIKKTKLQVACN